MQNDLKKNIVEMVQAEDCDDPVREEARLLLGEAVNTNADHEWDILVEQYLASDPAVQGLLNYVTILACGWSIPTLIKMAQGDDNIDCDHPCTPPLAATVTVDPNHPSVIIEKAMKDFDTADAEGKKKIIAKLNDLGCLDDDWKIIDVYEPTESRAEHLAKTWRERRKKKRAHLRVVSKDAS
jgi:hypothetical protein